jgi:predicted nucleotidyltransferase component of viral defense system
MSNQNSSPQVLNLDRWVEAAQADPVQHRQRQVTHILLHAVAMTPVLRDNLCLKGGTLMSAAYGSVRMTGDVDFSAHAAPEPFTGELRDTLNKALAAAAADLGYVDLKMSVQSFQKQPRQNHFETATGPALQLAIGLATRGTNAESRLDRGQASEVLRVDISFKEPIINVQVLGLNGDEKSIFAYSTEEMIAEKLRALVQQKIRNRRRRQDIYDIDWLIQNVALDEDAKARILSAFIEKADARDTPVSRESLDDNEIRERASAEWESLGLEIEHLPEFDELYERVNAFFKSLPWK